MMGLEVELHRIKLQWVPSSHSGGHIQNKSEPNISWISMQQCLKTDTVDPLFERGGGGDK